MTTLVLGLLWAASILGFIAAVTFYLRPSGLSRGLRRLTTWSVFAVFVLGIFFGLGSPQGLRLALPVTLAGNAVVLAGVRWQWFLKDSLEKKAKGQLAGDPRLRDGFERNRWFKRFMKPPD
jgi:hypothetical protein